MAALLFHSGAGSYVFQVARPSRQFSHVELDGLGDKVGRRTEGGGELVVLILQQVFGIREIRQQLLDEFLLILGDGEIPEGLV